VVAGGRSGKDDRKQNTVAPLVPHSKELTVATKSYLTLRNAFLLYEEIHKC
jgi:hypothetical protein